MVQREVGERLLAGPSDEGYGPASLQWLRATGELVRRVPPAVLQPRPRSSPSSSGWRAGTGLRSTSTRGGSSRSWTRGSPSAGRRCATPSGGWASPTPRRSSRALASTPPRAPSRCRSWTRADRGRPRGFARRSGPFGRSLVTGLRMPAHAKLNVFLRVLGVRSDGYHDVETDAPDLAGRRRHGPGRRRPHRRGRGRRRRRAGRGRESRAPRGARAGRRAGRRPRGADRVAKRIPVAAGLGGGSTDAAAVLRLLDDLWSVGAGRDELAAIALGIGSDVPALLVGRPTYVRGRGEIVEPVLAKSSSWVVAPLPFGSLVGGRVRLVGRAVDGPRSGALMPRRRRTTTSSGADSSTTSRGPSPTATPRSSG